MTQIHRLLLPLAIAGTLVFAGPAHAVAPAAAAPAASPDFDGDGTVDYALVHSVDDDFNEIVVRYGSGTELVLSNQAVLGKETGFVNHPIARDLNADGYTDLAFGAQASADGIAEKAHVGVVLGSRSGLDLATLHLLALPETGSRRGVTSLALVESPTLRLAIGTSAWTGGGHGEVAVYSVSSAGVPVGAATVLRPGSGKVPKLTDRDSFGTALATSGSQLFIGASDATVASKTRAGAVVQVGFGASGPTSAKVITQATKGVTGAPGKNDYFGASLAARDGYLVVGAPGDAVGNVKTTGSVQLFTIGKSSVKPVKRIWQGTTGVPGKAERNDRFGSSVGLGSVCAGVPAIVVGGSGEAIAKGHYGDGSVWVIPVKITKQCPARQLWEGHGIGGTPTYFRGLGGDVAVIRQAGESADRILMAGGGWFSEGPNGVLAIWSAQTLSPLLYEEDLVYGFAGR